LFIILLMQLMQRCIAPATITIVIPLIDSTLVWILLFDNAKLRTDRQTALRLILYYQGNEYGLDKFFK